MSAGIVKQLREIRKSKLSKIADQIVEINQDHRWSDEYKQEELQKLQKEFDEVKADYDRQINEKIANSKKELLQKFHSQDELSEKEEIKMLRMQIANSELMGDLIDKYKGASIDKQHELMDMAKHAIENNLPQAGAYAKALQRVFKNNEQANALIKKHEELSLTDKQKAIQKELDEIELQAREYEKEVLQEQLTMGVLNPSDSIAAKRRLFQLGAEVQA